MKRIALILLISFCVTTVIYPVEEAKAVAPLIAAEALPYIASAIIAAGVSVTANSDMETICNAWANETPGAVDMVNAMIQTSVIAAGQHIATVADDLWASVKSWCAERLSVGENQTVQMQTGQSTIYYWNGTDAGWHDIMNQVMAINQTMVYMNGYFYYAKYCNEGGNGYVGIYRIDAETGVENRVTYGGEGAGSGWNYYIAVVDVFYQQLLGFAVPGSGVSDAKKCTTSVNGTPYTVDTVTYTGSESVADTSADIPYTYGDRKVVIPADPVGLTASDVIPGNATTIPDNPPLETPTTELGWLETIGTILNGIANALNPASEGFFLRTAFVPAEGYLSGAFTQIRTAWDSRMGGGIFNREFAWYESEPDWTVQIGGVILPQIEFQVVDQSVIDNTRNKIRFWLGGIMVFLTFLFVIRRLPQVVKG